MRWSSARKAGLRGMVPGAPRVRLRDLPGVSRGQQLGDVARPPIRDGLLLLLEDEVLVDRRVDRREHADRNREVRRKEVGDELGGVDVRLVVNPEGALGHVLGADDLRSDALHDERAPVVRRPEEQGLAVLEPELVLYLRLAVIDDVPRQIVVHVAVLEDLDEARPLVGGGPLQHFVHVRDVAVDGAGHERRAAAERERERVDRAIHRAHRRRLRHLAELAGRRVLPLREPVDPVVEEQDGQVHVAAQDVQHVVAADREPVAVTRDHEDLQLGPRHPEPGGDRRRPAVDRVEAVGVHVVREAARAADSGNEDDVLLGNPQVGHRFLDRRQDGVVAAARAPAHVLIRLEVLLRVLRRFLGLARTHALLPRSWLMASWISSEASGRPRTRLKPTASTRYSARSTRTSWPLLISGTSTLRYSRRMWPRSGGSGFRCRTWTDATDFPSVWARSTAAVIAPYVPPQPTTSRSPVAGPLMVVGGISWATRRTFSARIRTMWSWFSASYEMLPVTSCFSRPPIRCSRPA